MKKSKKKIKKVLDNETSQCTMGLDLLKDSMNTHETFNCHHSKAGTLPHSGSNAILPLGFVPALTYKSFERRSDIVHHVNYFLTCYILSDVKNKSQLHIGVGNFQNTTQSPSLLINWHSILLSFFYGGWYG